MQVPDAKVVMTSLEDPAAGLVPVAVIYDAQQVEIVEDLDADPAGVLSIRQAVADRHPMVAAECDGEPTCFWCGVTRSALDLFTRGDRRFGEDHAADCLWRRARGRVVYARGTG